MNRVGANDPIDVDAESTLRVIPEVAVNDVNLTEEPAGANDPLDVDAASTGDEAGLELALTSKL